MQRPHAGAVFEVFVASLTVVLAIRTFFVLSLRVPTGSMEPTLRGVEVNDWRQASTPGCPGWATRLWLKCVRGVTFVRIVAAETGQIDAVELPQQVGSRSWCYPFEFHGVSHRFTLPTGIEPLRLGLRKGRLIHRGEEIVCCRVQAGDRVFLDRLTYNFRRPRRGEIVAFRAGAIRPGAASPLYVKRLVALGGETLRLADDGKVWVDDRCLRGVAGMRSRPGLLAERRWEELAYLHGEGIRAFGGSAEAVAPLLADGRATYRVEIGRVFVLGDNSRVSWDSRAWGGVSEREITGRVVTVYWPWRGG